MLSMVDRRIQGTVYRMRSNAAQRDITQKRVKDVRDGNIELLFPDAFSENLPKAIIANTVDTMARDLGESLAPLPALKCSAGLNRTQADKRRAEKKNKIGSYLWDCSALKVRMKWGGDQYVTYGYLPFRCEPDYECQTIRITVDDPRGAYFELDRSMKTVRYARVWYQARGELAALYSDQPAVAARLTYDAQGTNVADESVEVTYYVDGDVETIYVNDCDLTLSSVNHGYGFCPVQVAVRPGLHMDPRGQFDDVIYIQLAKAIFAQLSLDAANKVVQAPIIVPDDVTQLNLGPDAIMRTSNPAGAGRLKLDLPPTTFAQDQKLDQELLRGGRYPEGRLGQQSASVITGRGVEALMGTFDSQIKTGQDVLGYALEQVTEMAFRMMVKLWPNIRKTINGTLSGESFQLTFVPSEDIGDDTEVKVTYGFAAGMSPQNAFVALLQLRGDQIIDRDTFRRQLPFDVDTDMIQRHLDVERTEDALMQGLFASLQASGQMFAQGMADQAITFFEAGLQVIKDREATGKPVGQILVDFFQQKQQEQQQAAQEQQEAAAGQEPGGPGAGGPGDLPGVGENGLPQGVAPGQAGMAPGGMPSIQQLVAGVTGGKANMSASIRKRLPSG